MFQNKDFANVAFQKNVFGEFNKNVERIPCHTHKSEFNKVKEKKIFAYIFHKSCSGSEGQGEGKPNFWTRFGKFFQNFAVGKSKKKN